MTAATRRTLTRLRNRLPGIVLEVAALAALTPPRKRAKRGRIMWDSEEA